MVWEGGGEWRGNGEEKGGVEGNGEEKGGVEGERGKRLMRTEWSGLGSYVW